MRTMILSVLLAILSSYSYSQKAIEGGVTACDCGVYYETPKDEYRASDQVFAGKALGLTKDRKSIEFEVIRSWKGVAEARCLITYEAEPPCKVTYPFIIGHNYLVYAKHLSSRTCSRTKDLLLSAIDYQQFPNDPIYINPNYRGPFPPPPAA